MSIAKWIDHTLLKVDASHQEIEQLCTQAVQLGTFSVCVNPINVPQVYENLQGSDVKVCSVVGFPLGATYESIVLAETDLAISKGAHEIDMVMNVGAFKSGQYDTVLHGMKAVTELSHSAGVLVKVIVESAVLTDDEKRSVAGLVVESGADFLKTSTGYVQNPNLVHDIEIFIGALPQGFSIKAAGGIRNYALAKQLIDLGVHRIGASSTVKIVEEETQLHE